MFEISKRMPSKATGQNTKPVQFRDEACSSLWFWLLIWAALRLAVAVIWTTLLITITYEQFSHYWVQRASINGVPNELKFKILAVVLQLVELKMTVTFIVAGMKNSLVLYRIYYRYCILALIFYVIAIALCFVPDYRDGHYYGEIYLSYYIGILISFMASCGYLFASMIILIICLEVLLICLIKKVINKYSQAEDNTTYERV